MPVDLSEDANIIKGVLRHEGVDACKPWTCQVLVYSRAREEGANAEQRRARVDALA